MSTDTTGTAPQTAGMTPDELRDFYRRYIELANNRDFDRMAEFAHDEVIMNGTPVSRDDMVAEFRRHTDAVPDLSWEVQELLVDGTHVAARLVDTGTPVAEWNGLAPTGATVTFAETAFYEVVDGRFKHMWYLMDGVALQAQLTAQG
ncbi:ester cyclase [Promicromonospora sp. NPDC050880]|uniref:ester cyclase n=1 Tax=unclassified Promicromonospora TaxID=2647929 RepID=UPI0037A2ACF5